MKDKFAGKFIDEWEAYLAASDRKSGFELLDVSPALAAIMAAKEADEIVRQLNCLSRLC